MNRSFHTRYFLKAGSALLGCLLFAQACSGASSSEAEFPISKRSGANALETYLDLPAMPEEESHVALVRQDAVQTCMARQGFEYTPFASPASTQQRLTGGVLPGTRDFYESYGFGYSTTLFAANELPADLIGFPGDGPGQEVEDPNKSYLASLAGPEAIKYSQLLSGRTASTEEPGVEDCTDLSSYGFAPDELSVRNVVRTYESELAQAVVSSETWQGYVAEIKSCLSEAGFGAVARSVDGLLRDPLVDGQVSAGVELSVSGSLSRDFASHKADNFEGLRESQRYEMAVAGAAVSCGWPDRDAEYLTMAASFEEEIWASLQFEIRTAKRALDAAEWRLTSA